MSDKNNGQSGKRSTTERDPSPTPSTSTNPPPPPPSAILSSQSQDSDLFSFLSAMHLSGVPGSSAAAVASIHPSSSATSNIITASRKRKFLEQAGSSSSGKVNGLRHAFMRRGSREGDGGDEEAASSAAAAVQRSMLPHDQHSLQTPQCSQSGYADEEDHQHLLAERLVVVGSVLSDPGAREHDSTRVALADDGTALGGITAKLRAWAERARAAAEHGLPLQELLPLARWVGGGLPTHALRAQAQPADRLHE